MANEKGTAQSGGHPLVSGHQVVVTYTFNVPIDAANPALYSEWLQTQLSMSLKASTHLEKAEFEAREMRLKSPSGLHLSR